MAGVLKVRNSSNDAWINVGSVASDGADGVGSFVLIGSVEASASASLAVTGIPAGTYGGIKVVFENIVPSTDNSDLTLLVGYGVSPTYVTSYYGYLAGATNAGGAYSENMTNSTVYYLTDSSYGVNAAYDGANGFIEFFGFTDASYTYLNGMSVHHYNSFWYQQWFGGYVNYNAAMTAIKIQFNSGNITSGRMSVYGYKIS